MTDFEEIFRRHWPDVQEFSLYLCCDRAESEDLASEVFLRAWASTKPIHLGTVNTYLFVIVRNLYRDRLRRGTRSRRLHDSYDDPCPGPDTAAADRGELERTLAAMQQLSEDERAILAMSAFAAMPHDLIAAALEISLSAVKVRIHRARLKLHIALDQVRPRDTP